MRRSSSLKVSSYGIVNASNERKEGRDKKNEGRRKEEDRKAGTKDSTIYFCIKKEWFSLECRKVNGLICVTTVQGWLNESTCVPFSSNLTEVEQKPIHVGKNGCCTFYRPQYHVSPHTRRFLTLSSTSHVKY